MADHRQTWLFTFGHGHTHPGTGEPLLGRYVSIYGSATTTRRAMARHFGRGWSNQYRNPDAAGVDRFDLVELPRHQWPTADRFESTIIMPAPVGWVNTNKQRSANKKERIEHTRWIAKWREAGYAHGRAAGWPALLDVEIAAVVRFPADGVTRDSPNTYSSVKAVVDGALVDTGVLPDDNDDHVAVLCIRRGLRVPMRPYMPAGELQLTIRETREDLPHG